MDFWEETNWFAVQTKPFRENLAVARVANLDIEIFLPKMRRQQLVCGRWKNVVRALFPGYFFARFCPLFSLDAITYAPGVLRVVGTRRFPIPIQEQIISEIRSQIQLDGFVEIRSSSLRPGQPVRVEEGPLRGLIGKFEQEADDGKRVAILLDAINKARVLIERRWVAQVSP